jgi:hypothetical protein
MAVQIEILGRHVASTQDIIYNTNHIPQITNQTSAANKESGFLLDVRYIEEILDQFELPTLKLLY